MKVLSTFTSLIVAALLASATALAGQVDTQSTDDVIAPWPVSYTHLRAHET